MNCLDEIIVLVTAKPNSIIELNIISNLSGSFIKT